MAGVVQRHSPVFFLPVYLRCTGGEVGATSALAPKIGPLGLVSYLRGGAFLNLLRLHKHDCAWGAIGDGDFHPRLDSRFTEWALGAMERLYVKGGPSTLKH